MKHKSQPFPIKKGIPCQLKWNHSTVYLTMGTTASCHRVEHDPIPMEKFDFHNIPEKIQAREKMLSGQWPGRGCEHCKQIEDAGGISDRLLHLDFPGVTAPPELNDDPLATHVTPTQLEIYFGNTCNLKCIYCNSKFSSSIDSENAKFGEWDHRYAKPLGGLYLPGRIEINPNIEKMTDKLFAWLEKHLDALNKIIVLGGEPFLQKETERLIALLEQKNCPRLTLVIFSNLTVEHSRVQNWIGRLNQLKNSKKISNLQVVGSLDCWGAPAEYLRSGLRLDLYEKNFVWMLQNTTTTLSVNCALTSLTIPTLPDLVVKINHWSRTRPVYFSMMKAGDNIRKHLHPMIFGKDILCLGFDRAMEIFEDNNDSIKENYHQYHLGIGKEIASTPPNLIEQKKLNMYLCELDRRRGTNWREVFPTIAKLYDKQQS
jgi:organic radical activating enzyme